MAASDKQVYNVAVLLFSGADILDYSLPLEVFANTTYNNDIENPEAAFIPVTVARCVRIWRPMLPSIQ